MPFTSILSYLWHEVKERLLGCSRQRGVRGVGCKERRAGLGSARAPKAEAAAPCLRCGGALTPLRPPLTHTSNPRCAPPHSHVKLESKLPESPVPLLVAGARRLLACTTHPAQAGRVLRKCAKCRTLPAGCNWAGLTKLVTRNAEEVEPLVFVLVVQCPQTCVAVRVCVRVWCGGTASW